MCIIIDTNMWGEFLIKKEKRHEDMQCIHNWIENKGGKLAITYEGKYGEEFEPHASHELIVAFAESGQVKLCNKQEYIKAEKQFHEMKSKGIKIKGKNLKSNDMHVLALAKAGHVKILCTKDEELIGDFKLSIRGKIYKNKKKHGNMLLNSLPCP